MDKEVNYVTIRIDKLHLEEHVENICKTNLKRKGIQICKTCPFLGPVMDIMDENKWPYLPEFKEYRKFYRTMYPKN